jgi:Trk K+ transport system NAD-binding subunit
MFSSLSSEKPVVLCGLGRAGARVLEYLRAAKLPVVVVDHNCRPDDPRLRGMRLVAGDCRDRAVLEKAGVPGARGVLVITNDDLVNISTTLLVRSLAPDVRVVLRLFDQNLLEQLGQAISNIVALSPSLLTAPVIAMTAMSCGGTGAFRLEGQPEGARLVAELTVKEGDALAGRTIDEVTRPAHAEPWPTIRQGSSRAAWPRWTGRNASGRATCWRCVGRRAGWRRWSAARRKAGPTCAGPAGCGATSASSTAPCARWNDPY